MKNEEIVESLRSLYKDGSKHSGYQSVPKFVSDAIGYTEMIDETWRGDSARYAFLCEKIPWSVVNSVVDIGANTGFFTFSFSNQFPDKEFSAYEINSNHCELMNKIIDYFGIENVAVKNEPMNFDHNVQLHADVVFFLNVLHHLGADFDSNLPIDTDNFFEFAVDMMKKLRESAKLLVFQLGYNLWGNKSKPIISPANYIEMFHFLIKLFSKSGWQIKEFALYKRSQKKYYSLPSRIVCLLGSEESDGTIMEYLSDFELDLSSEFYRRPLIILE